MGDRYDEIADRLGIPLAARPAWRALAAPQTAQQPQQPPPPAPVRFAPGDPGWRAPGVAPLPPPNLPSPPGPKPGEEGFSIMPPPRPQPSPAVAPSGRGTPPAAPQRPMTQAERERAMIESAKSAEAVEKSAVDLERLKKQGVPMLTGFAPATAAKFAAAADASDRNASAANAAAKLKKNIEGATFVDDTEGGGSSGGGGAVAAAPLRMVSPGGRTAHSWAVQEGIKPPEEAVLHAEDAETRAKTAATLDYDAGQRQAEAELGYLDRLDQARAAHAVEQGDRAQKYEAAYADHVQKLDDLRAQIRSAQIDPWNGQEGLGRMMGGIAIALGAAGSALTGGPNAGLEAVKHSIAMTIKKQEGALDRLTRGAAGEANFLGTLKQQYGDIDTAKNAAWIAYLESAKSNLAKMMGSPDVLGPKQAAMYERAMGTIDSEIASRTKAYNEAGADKIIRHDVNAPPVYVGGAAMSATDEKSNQELTERLVKSGIPGAREDLNRVLAVVPKEREKGDNGVPGIGGIHGIANQLGGTAEKIDNALYSWLGSTQGQELRQSAAVLFNRQLKDESGAAVSDQELERQKAAFYGARDARSARAALIGYGNRLNALESTVRSGFKPTVNETQRQRQATEGRRLEPQKRFSGPQEPK